MKTTIQIIYDKGLFDNYANADKFLEDLIITTRRRPDLGEQLMSFKDFVHKYKFKNAAATTIKIYQILSSLILNDIKIYFRDGIFKSNIGVLNLHPR